MDSVLDSAVFKKVVVQILHKLAGVNVIAHEEVVLYKDDIHEAVAGVGVSIFTKKKKPAWLLVILN